MGLVLLGFDLGFGFESGGYDVVCVLRFAFCVLCLV